jgi:hypothetical protein
VGLLKQAQAEQKVHQLVVRAVRRLLVVQAVQAVRRLLVVQAVQAERRLLVVQVVRAMRRLLVVQAVRAMRRLLVVQEVRAMRRRVHPCRVALVAFLVVPEVPVVQVVRAMRRLLVVQEVRPYPEASVVFLVVPVEQVGHRDLEATMTLHLHHEVKVLVQHLTKGLRRLIRPILRPLILQLLQILHQHLQVSRLVLPHQVRPLMASLEVLEAQVVHPCPEA